MPRDDGTSGRRPTGVGFACEATLTVGVFAYVWLVIDPSLHFEAGPWFPAFARGADFAEPFLRRPGGPVQYVAALLAQYHYYAWAGAAITAAICLALIRATRGLLEASGSRPRLVHLVPPVLVLVLCNQYGFHLAALLSLTVVACAAALYARHAPPSPPARAATFAAWSGLVYYVCGPPYIIGALVCGVFELTQDRRLLGLIWLMAAESVPYLGGIVLAGLEVDAAFLRLTPFDRLAALEGRWALLPLFLFYPLVALWPAARRSRVSDRLVALQTSAETHLRPTLRVLLAIAVLGAILAPTFRGDLRAGLQIERLSRNQDWERLLTTAEKLGLRHYSLGMAFCVNRALLGLGRLSDEMFRYPQAPESLMLGVTTAGIDPDTAHMLRLPLFFVIDDADLQLGLVNEAEHWCHEALEVHGEHAVTLRRLALIGIVKGQVAAARQFLRVLGRNVIYDVWARGRLAQLEADPSLSGDPQVQAVRSVMLRRGPDVLRSSGEVRYRALLDNDPQHRAAFELLMADYLLNRRLDDFVRNLPRLDELGYHAIPRHYQEAILVYETERNARVELGSHWIAPETERQFAAFCRLVGPYQARNDLVSAQGPAAPLHGNTYAYYHLFGRSGAGLK